MPGSSGGIIANLREALAGTSLASLEWSELREKAIDRVAASGKASALGLSLWKAKYMLEAQAYRDAINGLLKHYRARYRNESEVIALKCVEQALSEWLGPFCLTCSGSKERMVGGLKVSCPTCDGSGLRRYGDSERAGRMKISMQQVRLLNHKLEWLAGEIGQMDRQVNEVLAVELERS